MSSLEKLTAQPKQIFNRLHPLLGREAFRSGGPSLWREQAHPDLLDLSARTPILQKFIKIARSLHHLTRNRAVNNHGVTYDVLEDPFIGGWLPPFVVLGLEPVNRDNQV